MACDLGTYKLFYYNIESFFDLSSIETMYRSDQDLDQNGISVLDRYSLTNNDTKFYDKLLKRGASKAFEVIQSLTKDIDNAFGYNTNPGYTVEELNDLETPSDYEDIIIVMEDDGTLTEGSLVVVEGDLVYFDGTEWVSGAASTIKYIFFETYLPVQYNMNNQTSLDEKLSEFISIYVVREWFKRNKHNMDLIEYEYQTLMEELKALVNYRKKVTKTYRTL